MALCPQLARHGTHRDIEDEEFKIAAKEAADALQREHRILAEAIWKKDLRDIRRQSRARFKLFTMPKVGHDVDDDPLLRGPLRFVVSTVDKRNDGGAVSRNTTVNHSPWQIMRAMIYRGGKRKTERDRMELLMQLRTVLNDSHTPIAEITGTFYLSVLSFARHTELRGYEQFPQGQREYVKAAAREFRQILVAQRVQNSEGRLGEINVGLNTVHVRALEEMYE